MGCILITTKAAQQLHPEKPPTDYYRDAPMSTDVAGVGSCGIKLKPRLAAFLFK